MVEMAGRRVATEAAGTLDFARHFSLLACIVVVLAATNAWRPAFGAVVWFGVYGALHSSAVALTWREPQRLWRLLAFVGIAGVLSMLSAALSLYATRHSVRLSGMGPALPLALSSGFGALGYAISFRWLGARLSGSAYLLLPVGCILATSMVLATGVYQFGGGLWFAAAWWLAFSAGLALAGRVSDRP
jgi:hypothetical protein